MIDDAELLRDDLRSPPRRDPSPRAPRVGYSVISPRSACHKWRSKHPTPARLVPVRLSSCWKSRSTSSQEASTPFPRRREGFGDRRRHRPKLKASYEGLLHGQTGHAESMYNRIQRLSPRMAGSDSEIPPVSTQLLRDVIGSRPDSEDVVIATSTVQDVPKPDLGSC